jgi:hypothetical protein
MPIRVTFGSAAASAMSVGAARARNVPFSQQTSVAEPRSVALSRNRASGLDSFFSNSARRMEIEE